MDLKGSRQLECAVRLAILDEQMLQRVTRDLYSRVAVACATTPRAVERNIRTVIKYMQTHYMSKELSEIAGYTVDLDYITNTDLIEILTSHYLRNNHNVE